MTKQSNRIQLFLSCLLIPMILASCSIPSDQFISTELAEIENLVFPSITATPFLPDPIPVKVDFDISVADELKRYFDDHSFEEIEKLLQFNSDPQCKLWVGQGDLEIGMVTFVLVEPFNSILDEISKDDLGNLLLVDIQNPNDEYLIYLSDVTFQILTSRWGKLSNRFVVVHDDDLFNHVLETPRSFGLLPFDLLDPKWKVVKVDGTSPIMRNYDPDIYGLEVTVTLDCQMDHERLFEIFRNKVWVTNRDENKMTVVLMTGTTALTRATAHKMEIMGFTYPGEEIKIWFEQSDIRHVSSETPFFEGCPFPNPVQNDLSFCSNPDYLELFSYLGINVIELTGNHLLDKGNFAFEETLRYFRQLNYPYYAGGYDNEEALFPLLIEHNGNKIAFLGCNVAGPSNAWATELRSGIAGCDYEALENQISSLTQEGYLPIVTFQYFESNFMKPSDAQKNDFRRMVDSGAVIVSGSQSHAPMSMEFYQNGFIHYGLGNLFFDQMDYEVNRQEFLDRHIFYEGKYINTEILTAMLHDYAQPIPMTQTERGKLLSDVFDYFEFNWEE